MFISPAYAQGDSVVMAHAMSLLRSFNIVIMYFLILRPQQKRAKQHQRWSKIFDAATLSSPPRLVGKVTRS